MGGMIRGLLPASLILTLLLPCRAAARDPSAPTSNVEDPPGSRAALAFFEKSVRPTLAEHCYRCHGPDSGAGKAKLRVDSLEALLKGGLSGPAIVRGEPERSLLILAVRHEGDVAMPPKKKLAAAEIEALTAWVKMGAPWPSTTGLPTPAPSDGGTIPRWPESARGFWAFRMPVAAPPPPVRRSRDGRVRPSTGSSWPGSKRPGSGRRRRPTGGRCCDARRSTSRGFPRPPKRSTRSCTTILRSPSHASSTDCWRLRDTASGGAGTGSTSSATPTPTAWTTTSPIPTPGAIATTSSAPSTPTSRSTVSSRSRSPATCSPNPIRRGATN